MFNFHQKREFNDVSREPAYMLNKYQSVKKLPPHESTFWSVLFRLSVRSSKFSNEVLHVKFDLQYFVKEMLR